MTLRKKANIISLLFILGGSILHLMRILYFKNKLFVLAIICFTYIIIMGIKIIKLRCPNCKKALIMNKIKYLGDYYYPTFYSPRYCSECNFDLESVD